MYCSTRKGTKDPEGDLDHPGHKSLLLPLPPGVRLFTQRMGLPLWFQWARMTTPKPVGWDQGSKQLGQGHSGKPRGRLPRSAVRGDAPTPVGLEGKCPDLKMIFLSLKIQWNFAFLGFGLA